MKVNSFAQVGKVGNNEKELRWGLKKNCLSILKIFTIYCTFRENRCYRCSLHQTPFADHVLFFGLSVCQFYHISFFVLLVSCCSSLHHSLVLFSPGKILTLSSPNIFWSHIGLLCSRIMWHITEPCDFKNLKKMFKEIMEFFLNLQLIVIYSLHLHYIHKVFISVR